MKTESSISSHSTELHWRHQWIWQNDHAYTTQTGPLVKREQKVNEGGRQPTAEESDETRREYEVDRIVHHVSGGDNVRCASTAPYQQKIRSNRLRTFLNTSLVTHVVECGSLTQCNYVVDEETPAEEGKYRSSRHWLDHSNVVVEISNNAPLLVSSYRMAEHYLRQTPCLIRNDRKLQLMIALLLVRNGTNL